jgi:uncharacterized protein (TIGR03382 family)
MRRRSPGVRLTAALFLLSLPAVGRDLPNYHSVYSGTARPTTSSTLRALNRRVPQTSAVKSAEARFALPTVIRAPYSAKGAIPSARTPADAAREHLRSHAGAYFLRSSDADTLTVKHVHDTGRGAIVVNLVSRPGGLEVWGEQLNVVMDRKLRLVGLTGYVSTPESAAALFSGKTSSVRQALPSFQVDHVAAVAAAYGDLTGSPLGAGAFVENGVVRGDYRDVQIRSGVSTPSPLRFPARARQVLFHQPGSLEPAYYVEVASRDPETRALDYYSYVISGRDARVLVRTNLVASAQGFTYRVWADSEGDFRPSDSPYGNAVSPAPESAPVASFVPPPVLAPQDVTLVSGPISTGDPWLPDDATETAGNNVDAYADLGGEDGYTPDPNGPDYRAQVTGNRRFQYLWTDAVSAGTNTSSNKAAIVHLFFLNNWFHDWYYDSGFNEAAGNGQMDNYGRGAPGGDQDPLFAEAFDFSGRDNANMWTPADGASPRMQMYVFDNLRRSLHVNGNDLGFPNGDVPAFAMSGSRASFDITQDVVQATPALACTAVTNGAALAGKIALVDRGTCSFAVKAAAVQAAGAIGVIFRNATNGLTNVTLGVDFPGLMVSNTDGVKLINAANGAGLNVRMRRDPLPDLDGAIDSAIVAHEWGHFISNRLIAGGALNLCGNCQGRGMGEGWADFHALLMLVREEDKTIAGNEQWQGAYGAGTYATPAFTNDPIWFGIRRATYSTDLHKNGTTFKFINTAFDPTQLDFPWQGAAGEDPTEVHATGEIWAAMLWECYASLLNAHPFAEAQQRMKDYLVAAYKVTPAFPTFVEARDAILQVAAANDDADYQRFGQAFAKRGLGVAAVAPDRADPDHADLVEDFTWGTNVRLEGVAIVDGLTNCDGDGILDTGEVGLVQVTLRNVGTDTVTGVTGTVESSDTSVTFPDTGALTFPSIAPGATGVATAKIALTGVTDPGEVTVTATVEGSTLTTTPQTGEAGGVLVNFDDVASASTDSFEAINTNWIIEYAAHGGTNPALTSWFRGILFNGGPIGWAVANNILADESLISPPIQVGATGDFILSWSSIAAILPNGQVPTVPYLGGVVVEITADDGGHWVDITDPSLAATITNGYNHEVATRDGAIAQYQSPLAGRMAFTAADASAPGFTTTTVNLHGGLGGGTIRVRFRYGGGFDDFNTIFLYQLDDFTVTGATNTPFLEDVADQHVCVPIVSAGPDQTVNEGATATLNGSASDLAGSITTAWTQIEGPPVTLSSTTAPTTSFTAPMVDHETVLGFRLTATGTNGTRSADVHVTVVDLGSPPVAQINGPSSAKTGQAVQLDGNASSDPDHQALTYAWSQNSGPPGTFSSPSTANVTFTTGGTPGNVVVSLRVTDTTGLSATTTKTLNVTQQSGGDDGGCNSTGAPSSVIAFLFVASFALLRRRRV